MNCLKKSVVLFLAILVLTSCFPAFSASAAEEFYLGKSMLSRMDNSSALLNAYDKILAGVTALKKDIPLSGNNCKISAEELKKVYDIVLNDHPEFFYLSGAYGYSYMSNNSQVITAVKPAYTFSDSAISTAKNQLNQKVSELTRGLSGKSEYEISLILHDRVAERVQYVFDDNDQNAYGALVEGKAVCAGYARAYQLLMQKMGIPCWAVEGVSDNPTTGKAKAHQWNLSKIDGKWYYTDVTWDDQDENLFYGYFNVTHSLLSEDHRDLFYASYLPKADSTDANYFYKNNLVFSSFDTPRLASLLKSGGYTTQIFVSGKVSSFRSSLEKQANSLFLALHTAPGSTGSFSSLSLGHSLIISAMVVEKNHKHSLEEVPAKKATCSSRGNTAYYTCSCGKWFSDAEGKTEITDRNSVKTDALEHTPSDYKTSETDHWQECTVCGAIISGSSKPHSDANMNGGCDVCGAKMKIPEKGEESSGNGSSVDVFVEDGVGNNDDSIINDNPLDQNGASFLDNLFGNSPIQLTAIIIGAVVILAALILLIAFLVKKLK